MNIIALLITPVSEKHEKKKNNNKTYGFLDTVFETVFFQKTRVRKTWERLRTISKNRNPTTDPYLIFQSKSIKP